ncbi:hypothetical protein M9Y10_013349 [Tritrichomonas musculus]|uniref:C2 domain-containing protein n=1 Tax=Tritrichomonas musculus TaxID=1915356 RepID=A0ABR2I6T0_9EUKA
MENEVESFYSELDQYPKSYGVLVIRVNHANHVFLPTSAGPFSNLLLRVQVGNITKAFRTVSFNNGSPKWNQVLHIPCTVYPDEKNPLNSIVFSLFHQGPFPGEESQVVGTLLFHLHDIIQANIPSGTYGFTSFDQNVGLLNLGMRFLYGLYGCGHSMQLVDEGMSPQTLVANSLFPKIDYYDKDDDNQNISRYENPNESVNLFFKKVDTLKNKLLNDKNKQRKLATLRAIVSGDFQNSEIPINLQVVETSNVSEHQKIDMMVPLSFLQDKK